MTLDTTLQVTKEQLQKADFLATCWSLIVEKHIEDSPKQQTICYLLGIFVSFESMRKWIFRSGLMTSNIHKCNSWLIDYIITWMLLIHIRICIYILRFYYFIVRWIHALGPSGIPGRSLLTPPSLGCAHPAARYGKTKWLSGCVSNVSVWTQQLGDSFGIKQWSSLFSELENWNQLKISSDD